METVVGASQPATEATCITGKAIGKLACGSVSQAWKTYIPRQVTGVAGRPAPRGPARGLNVEKQNPRAACRGQGALEAA